MTVRLVAKVGVSVLALLLAALPVMGCTKPGKAMTAAERDCCNRMAELCGRSGMAKSHSCCPIKVSASEFHALKATSSQFDHTLLDLYAQPIVAQTIVHSQPMFTLRMPSPTDSPPGLLGSATTILRI